MNLSKILVSVGCLVVIAIGGYFGSQYLKCQGLEEDYLNSVSSLKATTTTLAIMPDSDAAQGLERIKEQGMKSAEASLSAIYGQCGSRAGDTAARKATEMLIP